MNLSEKMSYLRGMVEGMELDLTSTKEGKVLGQLLDVMQEMTAYVGDLQSQIDELTEVCDLLDQDLGEVEDYLCEEDDEDCDCCRCEDDDDDYDEYYEDDDDDAYTYETVCPTCNNVIVMDESVLEQSEVRCPCCNELLELDLEDVEDIVDFSQPIEE